MLEKCIHENKENGWTFYFRILTDSARKRKRKEVLANYNKTRIKIAHHHDLCM
jgi:hypothetical protein